MRIVLTLVFLIFGTAAVADTFHLDAKVSKVVVYGYAGLSTRTAEIDLPVGRHQLNLFAPFLDVNFTPKISLAGTGNATVLSVATTTEFAPPVPLQKSARLKDSETELDAVHAELRAFEENSEAVEAELAAAELQLDLLRSVASGKAVTGNERGTIDPASLDAMVTLLGDRARTALKEVSSAKTKVSALARKRAELVAEVEIAEAAVEAATPEYDGMALLTIGAQVDS
ncbi:MAG: DUF4140 domain-containing protein, partial [Rhodobacteraceae bacterium]|nr:DUF4140 domain-containing protein [Paracoccaceae bacterium]